MKVLAFSHVIISSISVDPLIYAFGYMFFEPYSIFLLNIVMVGKNF